MSVLVSVIIPVYNVEKYLLECLDSILNQKIPFDEIIIVNDGSTDQSTEICRQYSQTYPQIILIEQENRGLSEARNCGLHKASGDYIVFVDSDDYISNELCMKIKKKASEVKPDIIYYAAGTKYDMNVKISQEEYYRDEAICNRQMNSFETLRCIFPAGYQMSACMAAYRRDFIMRCGIDFIEGIFYEDRFFSLRTTTEAENVLYLQDKLYVRRFRPDSIVTSSASERKIKDTICGHRQEWKYIGNNYKWKANRKLTQYFVLCGALMACQNDVSTHDMKGRKEYLLVFFKEWLEYFDLQIMTVNELCIYLLLIKQVEDIGKKEYTKIFSEAELLRLKEKLCEMLIGQCEKKLKQLPLGKECRIGIYGTGRHTTCMLRLYERFIGDIKAELYYIVTDTAGRDGMVKRIDELSKETVVNTDYFLLSSKMYQREMHLKLKERRIPDLKILKLYTMKDAVDYVMIFDALFE